MDKCKWEDGILRTCGDHRDMTRMLKLDWGGSISAEIKKLGIKYCPLCGANIEVPKEEIPVIKKDGLTWTARYRGIDYLYMGKGENPKFEKKFVVPENISWWKPFNSNEARLCDAVAQFRPMVMDEDSTELLLGVIDGKVYTDEDSRAVEIYRLANIDDLSDEEDDA